MSFNPDLNKQAQEVFCSRKLNHNNVSQASLQMHLGLTLDNCLAFDEHLASVSNKTGSL